MLQIARASRRLRAGMMVLTNAPGVGAETSISPEATRAMSDKFLIDMSVVLRALLGLHGRGKSATPALHVVLIAIRGPHAEVGQS